MGDTYTREKLSKGLAAELLVIFLSYLTTYSQAFIAFGLLFASFVLIRKGPWLSLAGVLLVPPGAALLLYSLGARLPSRVLPTGRRVVTTSLRALGVLAALCGAILWWRGGSEIGIRYKGVLIQVPLEMCFILVGILLMATPLLFLYSMLLFLPKGPRLKVARYLDEIDTEIEMLRTRPRPETISVVLAEYIRKSTWRFYTALATLCLLIFVLVPLIFANFIARASYLRESRQLSDLIQETRIEFSTADQFRQRLRELERSVPPPRTATRRSYDILRHIYDASVTDGASHETAVMTAYEEEISPHVSADTGLLDVRSVDTGQETSESDLARTSYLTLLANICNRRGASDGYVDAYLQAYQLLQLAVGGAPTSAGASGTHFALAVDLTGLLKTYDDYGRKLSLTTPAGYRIRSVLSQEEPLSRLSLIHRAKAEYQIALNHTTSNLTRARALNNQVDILLTSLHLLHIEGRFDLSDVRDEADRTFLLTELAPNMPGYEWQPERIIRILNRLREDLKTALTLSPEAEIFFTRAQLYSIGGALGQKYRLRDSFWGSADTIAEVAVKDLVTAFNMQLPKELFQQSAAADVHLNWLREHSKAPTINLEDLKYVPKSGHHLSP